MKIFLIKFWILLFGLHSAYGIPIHEFVTEESDTEFASPITPLLMLNTMENLLGKFYVFDESNFTNVETSTMAGKVIDTTMDVPDTDATKESDDKSESESTSEINLKSETTTLQTNQDSTMADVNASNSTDSNSEPISETVSQPNPSSPMSAPVDNSGTVPVIQLPMVDIDDSEGSGDGLESTSEQITLQQTSGSTTLAPMDNPKTEPETQSPMVDINDSKRSGNDSESTSEQITSQQNLSSTSAPVENSKTEPESQPSMVNISDSEGSESISEKTTIQNKPSSTIYTSIESSEAELQPELPIKDANVNESGSDSEPTSNKSTLVESSVTEPETKLPVEEEQNESTSETTDLLKTSKSSEVVDSSTETSLENTTYKEISTSAEVPDMLSNENVEQTTSTDTKTVLDTKTVKPELLLNFDLKGNEETSTEKSVIQTQPDTPSVASTITNSEKETPSERYTVIYLTTTEIAKNSEQDGRSDETVTEGKGETKPQSIESTDKPDNLVMVTQKPIVTELPMVTINLSNYNESSIHNDSQNVLTPLAVNESDLSAISDTSEDITTTREIPETTNIPDNIEEGSGNGGNANNASYSESLNKLVIENLTVQSVPNLINNSFTTAGPPTPDRYENGTINFEKLNVTNVNITNETETSSVNITTTLPPPPTTTATTTTASPITNLKITPTTQSTTTFSQRPVTIPDSSTISPHERVNKETTVESRTTTDTSSSTIPPTTSTHKTILQQSRIPKENMATHSQTASIILIAFSFFYSRILM